MNQNNLNNKFGKCCNCPALSNGNQLFTNFESSRLFNNDLRKKLIIKDSNTFRLNLQNNATLYIFNENSKLESVKCTSDSKNKFYIDSSKYDFSKQLLDDYKYPKIPNNYIKKSVVSNY